MDLQKVVRELALRDFTILGKKFIVNKFININAVKLRKLLETLNFDLYFKSFKGYLPFNTKYLKGNIVAKLSFGKPYKIEFAGEGDQMYESDNYNQSTELDIREVATSKYITFRNLNINLGKVSADKISVRTSTITIRDLRLVNRVDLVYSTIKDTELSANYVFGSASSFLNVKIQSLDFLDLRGSDYSLDLNVLKSKYIALTDDYSGTLKIQKAESLYLDLTYKKNMLDFKIEGLVHDLYVLDPDSIIKSCLENETLRNLDYKELVVLDHYVFYKGINEIRGIVNSES